MNHGGNGIAIFMLGNMAVEGTLYEIAFIVKPKLSTLTGFPSTSKNKDILRAWSISDDILV